MTDDRCTTLSATEALERLRQAHAANVEAALIPVDFVPGRLIHSSVRGWRYIIAEDRVERIQEDGSA